METIKNDDASALDRAADALCDGFLAAGATEASLLADLRHRRENDNGVTLETAAQEQTGDEP